MFGNTVADTWGISMYTGKTHILKFKRRVGLNKLRGEGSDVTQHVTSEITTLSVIGLSFVIFIGKTQIV